MAIKVISYKNWCSENISPQSWLRIVLRCMESIRDEGHSLSEYKEPNDTLELSDDLLEAFNRALEDLYQTKIEDGILT